MLRKLVIVAFFALFVVGCQTTRPLNSLHPTVSVNNFHGSYHYAWLFLETCERMGRTDKLAWMVETETASFDQGEGKTFIVARTGILLPNGEWLSGYYENVFPYEKNDPAIQNFETSVVQRSWTNALKKY